MQIYATNSPENLLWKGLFVSWIYLGLLRNIVPSISTPLYFFHDILILIIFLRYQPKLLFTRHTISWLLVSSSTLLIFIKFETSQMSVQGLAQGLNLYCLGMLLFASFDSLNSKIKSLDLTRIIQISMIPNLILAILQVPLKVPYFQKSELSNLQYLSSADGYIRAYGTFTSTTGFSLYLAVVFAYSLSIVGHLPKNRVIIIQLASVSMLVMSQSRTALVVALAQFVIYVFITRHSKKVLSQNNNLDQRNQIRIGKWIGISVVLIFLIFPQTLKAFSNRISQASQSENSFLRLFSQQFSWLNSITHSLFGDGLASHTIGLVGYGNVSQQWVERDLDRILQEAGVLLGLGIIFFRFFWAISLLRSFPKLVAEKDYFMVLLLPILIITFLQGPLYGQNDTNIFGWFFLSLFAARYTSDKAHC